MANLQRSEIKLFMGISKNPAFMTSTRHPSPEEKGTRSF